MNANELADKLDNVVENYIQMIADVDFSDVATMLRQQEAEIKALKGWKDFPEDASYFEVYNPWNMKQVLRFSKEFIEGYGNEKV